MQAKSLLLKYSLLLSFLLWLPVYMHAQKAMSGVYMTADDYNNNKLAYANPCGPMHKIKLNDFWGKKYIIVTHNDTAHKLMKDSIYAYADCDGKVYRFYKDYSSEYKIVENGTIVIYTKIQGVSEGKTFKQVTHYYFSNGLSGVILELTLENVKNAFPNDHMLHDELDKFFPSGNGITDYDSRHSMFRINHVLLSIKSK